jgi:hypothetical protein
VDANNNQPQITPYFPKEAYSMAKNWETTYKMPVFTWAMTQMQEIDCPNCGGGGVVYLRLAEKGPYATPSTTKQISTYHPGDGVYRRGWYVIKDTVGFVCPKCKGAIREGI